MANRGLAWRSVAVTVLMVVALTMMAQASWVHREKRINLPKVFVRNHTSFQKSRNPNYYRRPLLINLLALAVSASRKAGEIIRNVYKRKGHLNAKQVGRNFQTEADISSQKCIVASIKTHFTEILIVAEEVYDHVPNERLPEDWIVSDLDPIILRLKCPEIYKDAKQRQMTIWVDPLDGTKEFVNGHTEHVTVLIGISLHNKIVAGVMYQPFWGDKGRAIWGLVGSGFGGVVLSQAPPLPKPVYVTSSSIPSVENIFNLTLSEDPSSYHLIKAAGSGNRVIYVLEGRAHAYIYPVSGLYRWDTAAPSAVLFAARGELTDSVGSHLSYSKQYADLPKKINGVLAFPPFCNLTWARHVIDSFSIRF